MRAPCGRTIGRPKACKLCHVGFAQDDHARSAKSLHGRSFERISDAEENGRAAGGLSTVVGHDVVFQDDRDAMQGAIESVNSVRSGDQQAD